MQFPDVLQFAKTYESLMCEFLLYFHFALV